MADTELKDELSTPPAGPNPELTAVDASTGGEALRRVAAPVQGADGRPATPVDMPDFAASVLGPAGQPIDLLSDVELNVKVELGRCHLPVEEVLRLAEGSVVELDKLAGDPVDVLVNDRLVARGEVLVLNDTFCVRVNEIVAGEAGR